MNAPLVRRKDIDSAFRYDGQEAFLCGTTMRRVETGTNDDGRGFLAHRRFAEATSSVTRSPLDADSNLAQLPASKS